MIRFYRQSTENVIEEPENGQFLPSDYYLPNAQQLQGKMSFRNWISPKYSIQHSTVAEGRGNGCIFFSDEENVLKKTD